MSALSLREANDLIFKIYSICVDIRSIRKGMFLIQKHCMLLNNAAKEIDVVYSEGHAAS
jgi:hypothetical protein